MSESPFQAFLNLVSFDQNLVGLNAQQRVLQTDLKELELAIQHVRDAEKHVHQQLHDARKVVDQQELAMRASDEKMHAKKKQLEQADMKTYRGLKAEVDTLEKNHAQQEEAVLQAWNAVETGEKQIKQALLDSQAKLAEITQQQAEKITQLAELERQTNDVERQRKEKLVGVPEEWLETYEHMRGQVSDPVVPVVHDSCSACFASIPNQELIRLKRRALVQCNRCFRFLYDEQAHKVNQAEESSS